METLTAFLLTAELVVEICSTAAVSCCVLCLWIPRLHPLAESFLSQGRGTLDEELSAMSARELKVAWQLKAQVGHSAMGMLPLKISEIHQVPHGLVAIKH